MKLKKIDELDLYKKKVLLRLDLNLPRKNSIVTDITRITRSLQTINYLVQQKSKIIIISHLGRPKGSCNPLLSLMQFIDLLQNILKQNIHFIDNIFDPEIKNKINNIDYGEIILLENLRFYEFEEENNIEFSRYLSTLADCYINDTFSCSHRSHSSLEGVTKFLPSAAGFSLINELKALEEYLANPQRPLTVVVGGVKISTKIDLLISLLNIADNLVIVGAMANNFFTAKNINISESFVENEYIDHAKKILNLSETSKCKLYLPQDFVVSCNKTNEIQTYNLGDNFIGKICDIGYKTNLMLKELILDSSTVVWNGPLGIFEQKPFDIGTNRFAKDLAVKTKNSGLISIIGGGDTVASIKATANIKDYTYVCTGGGAFLEWLEGKTLPGIKALQY